MIKITPISLHQQIVREVIAGTRTGHTVVLHGIPSDAVLVDIDEDGMATWSGGNRDYQRRLPYWPIGATMFVREVHHQCEACKPDIQFRADRPDGDPSIDCPHGKPSMGGWRKAFALPRELSRMDLKFEGFKVRHLHETDAAQAVAEGVRIFDYLPTGERNDGVVRRWGMRQPRTTDHLHETAVDAFREDWIHRQRQIGVRWDDNPWVMQITFSLKRLRHPSPFRLWMRAGKFCLDMEDVRTFAKIATVEGSWKRLDEFDADGLERVHKLLRLGFLELSPAGSKGPRISLSASGRMMRFRACHVVYGWDLSGFGIGRVHEVQTSGMTFPARPLVGWVYAKDVDAPIFVGADLAEIGVVEKAGSRNVEAEIIDRFLPMADDRAARDAERSRDIVRESLRVMLEDDAGNPHGLSKVMYDEAMSRLSKPPDILVVWCPRGTKAWDQNMHAVDTTQWTEG